MTRNTGEKPPEAAGKRIRGVLRNGIVFGFTTPDWAADTTRWSIIGKPWDLKDWELAA